MTARASGEPRTPAVRHISGTGAAIAAVRAFGVTFGGALALDGAAVAALFATARALKRRRPPGRLAIAGTTATLLYAAAVRPWMNGWGMPDGEGDGHAVEIDAPPHDVWSWLAQVGQDRGGFYSYAWLENLAGCRMHNADVVHPEWQHRQVGEQVMLHPAHGVPVTRWDPGLAMALKGWGSFELEPLAGDRTRLVARAEAPHGGGIVFYELLVRIPHFVMERRMLLGIKERAEARVG